MVIAGGVGKMEDTEIVTFNLKTKSVVKYKIEIQKVSLHTSTVKLV